MSSKRHQQASIPPSLLSSSFWSNVFLSTAHRITFRTASYLPTAVNNNNTYKYRAMSSSIFPPLDFAHSREASLFGSPAASLAQEFGSPFLAGNQFGTSSLLLLLLLLLLGIPGPSRPRPTEFYQTPPRRNIPYLLPIITSGPGFHPGSQGQTSPSPVSGRGSALNALSSSPITPAPVRKVTVRNRGPDDSLDSTSARSSPASALTPVCLSPASVNSSGVSFGNFTRQTSHLAPSPSPSVLDDESPTFGSPPGSRSWRRLDDTFGIYSPPSASS
ncbi:hypothetical protein FPQ18DRAFT_416024 [Pyronema domesticum]|nr:hypothetical protein FPQ18DRAFT_416024 [Pyronema domesticum]